MSDSPAARRILDNAMQTRAQTPDEAYADLVRAMGEPRSSAIQSSRLDGNEADL